jgi:NAD(P)-dependent dehydrogenase (short-subunit alcohol dehydrogenase family)
MSEQFKDQVAIITGGASGIGLAIAKKLSRGGARCYRI